jgi:hypothetical protein
VTGEQQAGAAVDDVVAAAAGDRVDLRAADDDVDAAAVDSGFTMRWPETLP